tara:strand:+ start:182 stop:1231 length:1050 start_codon:yes stop_codon:yes gene_type:complete
MLIITEEKYSKTIITWLLVLIFLLITMIVVGGLTRLTNSGLSITEWDLVSGILPPLNNEKWNYYFSLYKSIPQYKLIYSDMSLGQFKVIYYWEYLHRLLGRVIGLALIIPLIYFIGKKYITKNYIFRFSIIFLLISSQGFIGWYMVQSGLTENVSVSHYRLSLHLFMAFIILSTLVWYFLNHVRGHRVFFNIKNSYLSIKVFIFLLYLQIIFGAFVSGLDAGNVYQTWPLMNGSYFPDDISSNSFFYIINFNQHSLVQFIHRNIAYLIFFISILIGYLIKKNKHDFLKKHYLPVFFLIIIQIIFGILALLTNLNLYIASLHQISSIFLIIFSLNFYHKSIKPLSKQYAK